MAICDTCGQDMLTAASCVKVAIPVVGKELDPIRYGAETHHNLFLQQKAMHPDWDDAKTQKAADDFLNSLGPLPDRCHDCNAGAGGYHHPGCDAEECPSCHGQLISCSCMELEAT
jgi:hypothetical protein